MVIHHPTTPLEAVLKRKEVANSLYLAGGTEDLRLNGAAGKDTELIDINGLLPSDIVVQDDGMVRIGALATLEDVASSALLPDFIREAARLCPSFERRNAATIGGNVGARRDDSFMLAALSTAGATFHSVTPHGEEDKKVSDYANTKCRRLIEYFLVDPSKKGFVKRFGLSSTTHAALIAAFSDGVYAISAKGSALKCGTTPDIWKDMEFVDGLEGSADYKRYLASIVFGEVK